MVAAQRIPDDDTFVPRHHVATGIASLILFLCRYKPYFPRSEHREHAQVYIEGLCSSLERKSVEPIATAHGLVRRPLQHFAGAGKWSDGSIRDEMRDHIGEEIGDPNGVFVIDGSAVPKSGTESVGVARQWCGHLGKVENCQVGVYLAYSARGSRTLLDGQLYLPEDWANDPVRRDKTHVPQDVVFRPSWQIADELIRKHASAVPHAWVVGDDEFGRPKEFRDALADRGERYLLEVPSNTIVRKPSNWPGRASKWRQVRKRKACAPRQQWKQFRLRDGEKGPIDVLAFSTRVETKRDGAPPRQETLLIVENLKRTQTWYFLAPGDAPLDTGILVGVMARRHDVEQVFQFAKGEVGLDHYELRSWVGWHHHVTLSMLALWFITLEQRRLGKKLPR